MALHMVRYTVKSDQAAHNEALVRGVFAELDQVQPAGLRYATFRLADGVTFINLVSHDTTDGHGPLPHLDSLRNFHTDIRGRCAAAPLRTELTEIGTFRVFGDA